VPQCYLTAGSSSDFALLQGLMDSDGYADEIERSPGHQVKFTPHLPVFRLERKLAPLGRLPRRLPDGGGHRG
jgi:intein/homing endonuclease